MADKITIVNLALTMLGHKRLTTLTGSNKPLRDVNAVYTPVLEDVLTALDWGFARKQAKLALVGQTSTAGVQPVDGWEYLYAQPSDCLKARRVHAQGHAYKDPPDEFLEFQDPSAKAALASNVESAWCRYTARVTDTTKFDAPFVKAFAAALAEELAMPLTSDVQKASGMAQLKHQRVSEAKRLNITRSRDKQKSSNGFVDSRR